MEITSPILAAIQSVPGSVEEARGMKFINPPIRKIRRLDYVSDPSLVSLFHHKTCLPAGFVFLMLSWLLFPVGITTNLVTLREFKENSTMPGRQICTQRSVYESHRGGNSTESLDYHAPKLTDKEKLTKRTVPNSPKDR
jgi:hypothetical protein